MMTAYFASNPDFTSAEVKGVKAARFNQEQQEAGDGPHEEHSCKSTVLQYAKIWVEHPEKVWESATVITDYRSGVLVVKLDHSGEIRQLEIKNDSELPPLCNPPLLKGHTNLTSLSYLHEPAVLHNLKVRFCDRNALYTYCGVVLVAINPYHEMPIYGNETISVYRGQAMGDLDPHIFAVSEEAYAKLERERRNQSIIVSGESGAGKTVSAKYAMRYFATVGGKATDTQIEKKVLISSTIMEAIGNAKTIRNDNSSRFGKFIEIHFDDQYRICGASMRTYLLEKSRVVHHSVGERNYHIFYQLCSAALHMPELKLDHPNSFHYLNQGCSPNIDGVDDLIAFNETRNELTALGVTESEQQNIFAILAVILHLGNIDLTHHNSEEGDEEGVYIKENDEHIKAISSLLGISETELTLCLTHRRIQLVDEVIESRMNTVRAKFARDALAKRIYGELFAWLVQAVNRALDTNQLRKHFIGILDIYGFEMFETNSFEQFCINYANEKLQHQFNCHVFKLEQDEYNKEDISWKMIDFYDNQPCIQLIEDRLGVLALLDEECRFPQGSDISFASKLRKSCGKYQHYMNSRFSNSAFIIKHFADNVEYQCEGFLVKNRDTVLAEQVECIKSSTCCTLIREIFATDRLVKQTSTLLDPRRTTPSLPHRSPTLPGPRLSGQNQTVGAHFRASLSELMSTLSATTPYYVRCIKPNYEKCPYKFDDALVVNQLRACGVLETLRISAAGFPSRLPFRDFFNRYCLLCLQKEIDPANIKTTCERILARYFKDIPDKYQFGATKIFFRAGQVAYLEKIRFNIQRQHCVMVQSCVRRFVARRKYLRLSAAVTVLQAHARGYLARCQVREILRNLAAAMIQRNMLEWLARVKYQRLRKLTIGLQAHARGYLARRLYKDRMKVLAVITLQKYWRGFLARQKARQYTRQIVVAQSAIRRYLARCQFKRLRIEARSRFHVNSPNKGLEIKIISLQQRLEAEQALNKIINPLQAQIIDLKAKLELLKNIEIKARMKEIEAKMLKSDYAHSDSIISDLKKQLEAERDSNMRIIEEKKEVQDKYEKNREVLEQEREKHAIELKTTKEHYELLLEERDKQTEIEKKAMSEELEAEKQSRQKLLCSHYQLQERLDSMQRAPPAINKTPDEAVNLSADAQPAQNEPAPIADEGSVLSTQNQLSVLQSELSPANNRAEDREERLTNYIAPQNAPDMPSELTPVNHKKKREYLGIFTCREENEALVIKKLVLDLEPNTALGMVPCLPAYILFMMLRNMDQIDDVLKIHKIMKEVRTGVKKILKKRQDSMEYNMLWLANVLRFLNNLRQYSGDVVYQTHNTPRQNQQCLRSFDLYSYRVVLRDIGIRIYQGLITLLEQKIESRIIPAILENADTSMLSGLATGLSRLTDVMNTIHEWLYRFHVDECLRVKIFKQLVYYICAYSVNKLLLRQDLCYKAKGRQIQSNIWHLKTWLEVQFAVCGQKSLEDILSMLSPITQAAQLLQARKSIQDVQSTVKICSNLNSSQVGKILYDTLAEEDEETRTQEFINKVLKQMKETEVNPDNRKPMLLMDTKMIFAVEFPFSPSSVRLEDIELNSDLNLDGLLTKI